MNTSFTSVVKKIYANLPGSKPHRLSVDIRAICEKTFILAMSTNRDFHILTNSTVIPNFSTSSVGLFQNSFTKDKPERISMDICAICEKST